jgi:hypothetical protein
VESWDDSDDAFRLCAGPYALYGDLRRLSFVDSMKRLFLSSVSFACVYTAPCSRDVIVKAVMCIYLSLFPGWFSSCYASSIRFLDR